MWGVTDIQPLVWTAIGAIAGFVPKFLWDRYWRKRDELATLRRNKKLELLERQLSEFYWPVYLRLQKDNAVWQKILDSRNKEDSLRQRVGTEIEKTFILPNHDEIIKLIESKIHLAKADAELLKQLLTYIRHIAVYKAMRSSGVFEYDPIHLGEPWPEKLFPLIEERVKALQQNYDTLLDLKQERLTSRSS